MSCPKYAIFKGLQEGNKFFSTNCPNEDQTKLADGTVAYEIIGYANSIGEAQVKLFGYARPCTLLKTKEDCSFFEDFTNRQCSRCSGYPFCTIPEKITPKIIEKNKLLKQNAIRLATHHRKHCDGEECNISLSLLLDLLELAGIELTEEEKRIFY